MGSIPGGQQTSNACRALVVPHEQYAPERDSGRHQYAKRYALAVHNVVGYWIQPGKNQEGASGSRGSLKNSHPARDAKGDGVISVAIRGGDQRQDGGKAGAGSMIHDRRWAPEPNRGKQCCDGKRGLNDISVSKPGAQGASQCKGCHRMRVIVLRIGGFHNRGHERPGVLDEERPNFKAKHEAGRDNHAYGRSSSRQGWRDSCRWQADRMEQAPLDAA